jgi:hypothetical protein
MAEHPANPRRSLVTEAVREVALLAEAAATTGLNARDDHVVPDGELGHSAANLNDRADTLVTKDAAGCDSRHVPFQDV